MVLGLSTENFTLFHVVLSLVAIAAGFVVVAGLFANRRLPEWTAVFLATTVATSATGFLFHSARIGPPHIVGALSLVVLAIALYALYLRNLAGRWRRAFLVSVVLSLYLNIFVAVVQAFQKLPTLHTLAPTQKEPPFAVAQLVVLGIFIALGIGATRRFRPPA